MVIAEIQEALLGLRVLTQMGKRGISIPKLAQQAGLPLSTVQKIVAGKSKQPSLWTIRKLADTLDVSIDYLAGRAEKEDGHS